jgi:uncharacterized membrane protein
MLVIGTKRRQKGTAMGPMVCSIWYLVSGLGWVGLALRLLTLRRQGEALGEAG